MAAGQTTGPAGTEPARGFTLGKETTRIVEPLLADGRPDYVGAVNEELSKGVTPENNALVGLLEVIGTGPEVIVPRVREEALRRLGMKGDGEGAKFERLDAYLKRVGKAYDDAMQDE